MIIPEDGNNAQGDDGASQKNQDHFFSDRHVNRHPKKLQILRRSAMGLEEIQLVFQLVFPPTIPNIFEILLKKIRDFSNLTFQFSLV